MSNNGTFTNPIPESVQRLWDVWDLRVCVLFSLSLQTFLILGASLRKRTASKFIIMLIWSAYLLADWVAAFALGLISNSNDESFGTEELLAFWGPFLLVHLGGPDTITAFALEDNELWLRHWLGLIVQFFAAAYIFAQTLPSNKLWPATLLMFLTGLVKYAERTRALYLASLGRFRDSLLTEPDPGPNYAKLMAEYSSMKDSQLPANIEKIPEPETYNDFTKTEPVIMASEREKVRHAYEFFNKFKGLIVDLIFSFHDRNESREFFLQRDAEDAFEVIEIELSFMYEILYTKVEVVHTWPGYILRSICFIATLVALLLFMFYEKNGLRGFDIITTYLLLIGAMILDCIALLMLVFSDWTIAAKKDFKVDVINSWIVTKFPIFKRSRWSESMSQFNLIEFCLSKRSKRLDRFVDLIGLKDLLDEVRHKSSKHIELPLKQFIFNDLKKKSVIAKEPKTAKEICAARGDWVLGRSIHHRVLGWSTDVEYDESLLLWHIATEIVYHKENEEASAENNEEARVEKQDREFSKHLSDYMLYLLVMQPTMMSAVAGIGLIRYRDTCAEAKVFFTRVEAKEPKGACRKLIGVNTEIKPAEVKGDRSKSVLFDAVRLAKDLETISKGQRWRLMSQVWLELLSYAASQCRANSHAQQLSRGGELLSFVWLLMTHLGLGEQFRIETGHARAKLIVEK
ncbi:putative transmembrane protein [Thalictrum thalictroides]|uniref:Putative transmembrane protein n=1 Tax=Thalictrum thalictroides TaxID=46969 RepID=A0A7J6WAA7_THATH|nr:putative transmembrane protein [Thalictrum thalictroides]